MELRQYLAVLRRRLWTVATVVTVAFVFALILVHLAQRQYTATSTIHFATGISIVSGTVRSDDVVYLDRLENTYAKLATGADMVARLQRNAGLSHKPGIKIQSVPNTELMQLSVTTTSPSLAAKAADDLAHLLIGRVRAINEQQAAQTQASFDAQISRLSDQIDADRASYATLAAQPVKSIHTRLRIQELQAAIRLETARVAAEQKSFDADRAAQDDRTNAMTVAEQAVIPTSPSSPKVVLDLAIAIALGLVGGVGLAFLMENLSTRFTSKNEIADFIGLSVLGSIPTVRSADELGVVNHSSPGEEAFRRLTAGLLALEGAQPFRSILVTSAAPGEGKSLTTLNLGRSIADRNKRVVVVDADLRIPTLHRLAQVNNENGLADVLTRRVSLTEALCATKINPSKLWILPSGTLVSARERSDPGHLLALPEMADTLSELARRFDIVLVDSPAVLAVSDALALAQIVDTALLVVSENQIGQEALRETYDALISVNAPLLGIVVNRSAELLKYNKYYTPYAQPKLPVINERRITSSVAAPSGTTTPVKPVKENLRQKNLRQKGRDNA